MFTFKIMLIKVNALIRYVIIYASLMVLFLNTNGFRTHKIFKEMSNL